MLQTITTADARNNFADLLGKVYYGGKKYLIKKLGKPFAVLINVEEYQRLEGLRITLFEEIESSRSKNKKISAKEVEADIKEAITTVRGK